MFEQRTQATTLPIALPDLTDCHSPSCWPIVMTSWLLVDIVASPRGCDVRAGVLNFWPWYFSISTSRTGIFSDYLLVQSPLLILDYFSVLPILLSVTCSAHLVDTVALIDSFTVLGPTNVQFPRSAVIAFHSNIDGGPSMGYQKVGAIEAI